mmetsp:Transcript_75083/g.200346  ORF Transcript_75083/g.200346 Transcript_75083/m.200346 type:complete len:135 (+) Transcript_75083:2003-2407(+)
MRCYDSHQNVQRFVPSAGAADEAGVELTGSGDAAEHTVLEPHGELSQVAAERDSLSRTLQRLRDQLHEVMLERDAYRETVREWTEASPARDYHSSAHASGDNTGRVDPPPLPPESEAVALLRQRGGGVRHEKWV